MARKNESPQKAAMREMMRGYLKDNDIWIKFGFVKLLKSLFKINNTALLWHHKDDENLWQVIFRILGVYFEDDCTDEIIFDFE